MAPYHNYLKLEKSNKKIDEKKILNQLSNLVIGKKYNGLLTVNAREALKIAFHDTITDKNQVISIITPSNSGYVSSCVTNEIDKVCKWKFGPIKNADAYVLIHEFGRCATLPFYLKNTDKPIIEDCAYSMTHKSINSNLGKQGDYVVFSTSKAMGLQYGGALILKKDKKNNMNSNISLNSKKYLINYMDRKLKNLKILNLRRKEIYNIMKKTAKKYNLEEKYKFKKDELCQGFLVKVKENHNTEKIKEYMNNYGVESSIFYGGSAYFLPCHQNLTIFDINYMLFHLSNAIKMFNRN